MIINLILVLIIILLIILLIKFNCESFNGYVFAQSPPPPCCSPHNNCFQGQPVRFTLYENMCEPEEIYSNGNNLPKGQGLLRAPRQLKDSCIRGFRV